MLGSPTALLGLKPVLCCIGDLTDTCEPRPSGLAMVAEETLRPGAITYINDHLSLHSVGCPDSVPAPGAVTMHLYAPPVGYSLPGAE